MKPTEHKMDRDLPGQTTNIFETIYLEREQTETYEKITRKNYNDILFTLLFDKNTISSTITL